MGGWWSWSKKTKICFDTAAFLNCFLREEKIFFFFFFIYIITTHIAFVTTTMTTIKVYFRCRRAVQVRRTIPAEGNVRCMGAQKEAASLGKKSERVPIQYFIRRHCSIYLTCRNTAYITFSLLPNRTEKKKLFSDAKTDTEKNHRRQGVLVRE